MGQIMKIANLTSGACKMNNCLSRKPEHCKSSSCGQASMD